VYFDRQTNLAHESARQPLASVRRHDRDLVNDPRAVLPLAIVTKGEWADHAPAFRYAASVRIARLSPVPRPGDCPRSQPW